MYSMLKNFFGGNLDFSSIEKFKKFILMSEPEQQYQNNVSFKQKYNLTLLIAFKIMAVMTLVPVSSPKSFFT